MSQQGFAYSGSFFGSPQNAATRTPASSSEPKNTASSFPSTPVVDTTQNTAFSKPPHSSTPVATQVNAPTTPSHDMPVTPQQIYHLVNQLSANQSAYSANQSAYIQGVGALANIMGVSAAASMAPSNATTFASNAAPTVAEGNAGAPMLAAFTSNAAPLTTASHQGPSSSSRNNGPVFPGTVATESDDEEL